MIRCHFCRLSDTQVECVVVREMGGRIDNAICSYCIEAAIEARQVLRDQAKAKSATIASDLIVKAAEKGAGS